MLMFCAAAEVVAQDPQFSQFYAAPLFLNPALTGSTAQGRVALNYRNQWPAIPGAFVSYNASFDYYLSDINSGVGVILTHDKAGSGALTYTNFGGSYSYEFKVSKNVVIKPGIQFSLYKRGVDLNKLTFSDQLARGSGRSTVEYVNSNFTTKFDFASGLMVYGRNFWAGFAGHHLNGLNESLLGQTAALPPKYSLHGGGRYVIKQGRYGRVQRAIWGAFNLKQQSEFRQLDLGVYMEFYPIVIGTWYRGLPVGNQPGSYHKNTDAITVLLGTKIETLQIGYSYDLTLSRLIGNTGGSHEISVVYEFVDPRPKKHKMRIVPCPQF